MTLDVAPMLERLLAADERERSQALRAFRPEAREALQRVRRHGPGRLRSAALQALAFVDGEAGLDLADVALLERLVRVRLPRDDPATLSGCWLRWWAVRSDDQAAVMASVGLHDLRPVTHAIAEAVLSTIEHHRAGQPFVFVGPAFEGWTTIVGPWCDAFHELPDHPGRLEAARADLRRLSARFGEAHAFYSGEHDGGSRWLVARDGHIVRTFDPEDLGGCSGAPLEFEHAWLAAEGLAGRPEDHFDEDGFLSDDLHDRYLVRIVASDISDTPSWFTRSDPRHGTPGLATLPGFSGPAPLPAAYYTV